MIANEGSRFAVRVVNGGGEEWMFHTVSRGGIPITKPPRQMSREQHDEIERALADALDYWRKHAERKNAGRI